MVKREGGAGREPSPDTPAAAAARKAQVDAEMWRSIVREIRRLESAKAGQPPLATADEIWGSIRFMLGRQNIPVEAVRFLGKLQIKREKHRPPLTFEQRMWRAVALVDRVDVETSKRRIDGIEEPESVAIERLANAHSMTAKAFRRKYQKAVELLGGVVASRKILADNRAAEGKGLPTPEEMVAKLSGTADRKKLED
jgi:hypothetical protein